MISVSLTKVRESKIRVLFTLCFLLVAKTFLPAQSIAQEIENLLDQQAVTYSQVARFVLDAADVASISDPEQAFYFAQERNWLPRNAAPDQLARLDGVSLLIMRAFDFQGGIMFSLTGSPRHAYRELIHNGVIQGRAAPNMRVSGYDLLFIINRAITITEEAFDWAEVSGVANYLIFFGAANRRVEITIIEG